MIDYLIDWLNEFIEFIIDSLIDLLIHFYLILYFVCWTIDTIVRLLLEAISYFSPMTTLYSYSHLFNRKCNPNLTLTLTS